ncbi:MAG TPA: BatD family protein, partial [Myxococcota bacterium]|nr:BatD family protein [Myxococcota bacterium]
MRGFRPLALLLAGVGSAQAQTVRVEATPAPHYAGEPVEIHVVAEGFDEDPAPTIAFASPERGELVAAGVRPSVSTSISIINGQVQRSKQVTFTFVYQLQVDDPGPLSIGPFAVAQQGRRASSRSLQLDFRKLPTSDQMSVELELPSTPVYVGERVPVALRFRLKGSLRENLHQYALRVPLFGMTDSFQFLEPSEGAGTTKLEVQTPSGSVAMLGIAREETRDGEAYLSVEIRRLAVPLRAGTLAIPAATLDVEEGVRFTRDLFGGRRPTQLRKWRSIDAAREIDVKPIPAANTPPSFAGAVGSGFALTVSADRTVVKVGEPIALRFELRGDGNLETAALPRLDAEGMLPRESFRVAEGEVAGSVEDGVKRFTTSVRVIDPRVREIPALEYAWFDPASQRFQTTRSLPIALSVGDARTVGAADVLSREPAPGEQPQNGALESGRPGAA